VGAFFLSPAVESTSHIDVTDRPQAQPDTLPPPPGEDDVYSAETRVDPLPKELLELMRSSRAEAAKSKAEAPPAASSTAKTPVVPPPPPVPRPSRPGAAAPPPSAKAAPEDAATAVPRSEDFADFGYTEESTEPTLDKPIRYINKAREMAGLEALKEPAAKEPPAPVSAPQPVAQDAALPEPLPSSDIKPTDDELGTRRGIPFPLLLLLVVIVAALAAWLVSALIK
jgi:hypothetical protein